MTLVGINPHFPFVFFFGNKRPTSPNLRRGRCSHSHSSNRTCERGNEVTARGHPLSDAAARPQQRGGRGGAAGGQQGAAGGNWGQRKKATDMFMPRFDTPLFPDPQGSRRNIAGCSVKRSRSFYGFLGGDRRLPFFSNLWFSQEQGQNKTVHRQYADSFVSLTSFVCFPFLHFQVLLNLGLLKKKMKQNPECNFLGQKQRPKAPSSACIITEKKKNSLEKQMSNKDSKNRRLLRLCTFTTMPHFLDCILG